MGRVTVIEESSRSFCCGTPANAEDSGRAQRRRAAVDISPRTPSHTQDVSFHHRSAPARSLPLRYTRVSLNGKELVLSTAFVGIASCKPTSRRMTQIVCVHEQESMPVRCVAIIMMVPSWHIMMMATDYCKNRHEC